MRLYHSGLEAKLLKGVIFGLLFIWAAGCGAAPQATQGLIQAGLAADGETITLQLPAGSTVQQALDQAGLSLNALDRTEPPVYTVLGQGAHIRLVRVSEAFEVEQVTLPFERQTLRNESLPVEKEVLIQRGQNGLQEITYRRVFEDGVEISREPVPVNSVILKEPQPEVRMIGVQTPFLPVDVPGTLYYLRDGNLWKIEGSTGSRRAVLTPGDLDGRVLSPSPDGNWVLVTRRGQVEGRINTLWAAYIGDPAAAHATPAPAEDRRLVDLGVSNVVHFADWAPGSNTKIYFSTVEPRPTAPGWQANNDLQMLTFSDTGWTTKWATIVEANSGGVYGWWGARFEWDPSGQTLGYARPDGLGVVDVKNGLMTTTLQITPLQTFRDWAWVPGATWGPDGMALYTTEHTASAAAGSPEESPNFDLSAVLLSGGPAIRLVSGVGMFAYPLASPLQDSGDGSLDYQVAYLQALFPERSETSRYRLALMDRDGSNRRLLFPPEESKGLEPQLHWGAWSPAVMPGTGNYAIAIVYEGDLWLVDSVTGQGAQVTGDGLTTRVFWTLKP
ncbi:MAG: G5 domain-containing protein [Chloroflexota bacterium]